MLVKELIAYLQNLDSDIPVVSYNGIEEIDNIIPRIGYIIPMCDEYYDFKEDIKNQSNKKLWKKALMV